MKKAFRLLLPALFLTALPAAAHAGGSVESTASVDSSTILRVQQDTRTGFDKRTFAPVTEFLGLDLKNLADGNLSAHFYGWGRVDLAEESDGRAEGNLTYGYLQYRMKSANGQARLGRFFVNEGIVNEQVDGFGASTDLPFGFGVSSFGGATVHTTHLAGENTDGKGDAVFGGRVHYRYSGLLEVGLAGVYETAAPTLVSPEFAGKFGDHRLVGGDVWLNPHRMVQVYGHSSYNTETSNFAEHSYLVNLRPRKDVTVSATFDEHHERDLFYSSLLFASFVESLAEQSRAYGGSAVYEPSEHYELSGDFKEYERDFGKAQRFGGEVRGNFLKNSVRAGLGYHYLRSGENFAIVPAPGASGSFHEGRIYAMRDTKSYFSSLDLIGYFFKKEVDNRRSTFEAVGSLGYHLTPALALSGDLSYGHTALFNEDVRGLLRLTYNTNFGKGESK